MKPAVAAVEQSLAVDGHTDKVEGAVVDLAFEPSDCLAVGRTAVAYMERVEVPFPFRGFLAALSADNGESLQ